MSTRTTCVRITRRDGVALGLTELDKDLTISGLLYKSAAGYTPSAMSAGRDMSVANADLEGVLGVLGVSRDDIRAGLYDGARVELLVVDYLTHSILARWTGYWGAATLTDGRYTAEYRSLAQRLQAPLGDVYTPTCTATLFDSRCGLSRASYKHTATLVAVSSDRRTLALDAPIPAGFAGGRVELATGEVAEIRATAGESVELFLPLIRMPSLSSTVTALPGCSKSLSACRAFENAANFRGFPHVPGRDALLQFGGQ